jgi:hypothetical protein
MEKLIKNKKNLYIVGSIFLTLFLSILYFSFLNSSKNEKYFDIILASLYNNKEDNQDSRLLFLSSLDDPNISFFGDLNSASIDNLDKYEKLDKDLILLKKIILDSDESALRSLSLDESFTFNEIAKIFFLNADLSNYNEIYNDNTEDINNFFLKAVSRYNNEIN